MIQAITQQRLEQTLARYIAMPTVTTDIEACTAAMQSIAAEYQKFGMATHLGGELHPWLVATTTPEAMVAKKVKVLFVIHFDVVPFENEAQTALQATPDKLFGRGVYDMKFAAAAVTEMLADFAKAGSLQDFDLGVLFTTDEEKGGHDGALDFLKQGWGCDIAVIPDGGYNWTVERQAKGMAYLYLTAYGRTAHSSRPWLGDNPIHKLTPALAETHQLFPNSDHDGLVVSVNSIESNNGSITNTTQIPKWVRAGISLRSYEDTEMQSGIKAIQAITQKYSLTLDIVINEPSVHLQEDNPLVQKFIQVASDILGEPVGFSQAYASSDARHFSKFGIPSVQMYPNGGDHHGPNEWVMRSDLFKYYMLCKRCAERAALVREPINSTKITSAH